MTSVPNGHAVICRLEALGNPGAEGFTLGSGEWPLRGFVVRKDSEVFAYLNRCPHARFPLNWQPNQFLSPEGTHLMCRMHGALFEIHTGVCVAGPCVGQALRTLPIEVRDGLVVLGDDPDELARQCG